MPKKARLGLYLKDEDMKRRVKMAAARCGESATSYCAAAIEERLRRDGEGDDKDMESRRAFLARVDRLKAEIGPIGKTVAQLVKAGRRR